MAAFNFDDVAVTPVATEPTDEDRDVVFVGETYAVRLPEPWLTISGTDELEEAITAGTVPAATEAHEFFRPLMTGPGQALLAVSPDQRDLVMVVPVRSAGITFSLQDTDGLAESIEQLQRDLGRDESEVNATPATYGENEGVFSKFESPLGDVTYTDYQFSIQDYRGVHLVMVLLSSGEGVAFAESVFASVVVG